MNNIPEATPPKRVRPHYKALYEESQKENDELKEEAEENKKLFDTTFSEYMKLKADVERLEKLQEENDKLQEKIIELLKGMSPTKVNWEIQNMNHLYQVKMNKKQCVVIAELKADVERLEAEVSGYENTETDDIEEIRELKAELLQTKFDAWREVQQEIHPQYSIDEEIGCLLSASDDTKLIKKIFDELYYGEYVYVIETEKYREWEDEDDE